MSQKKKEDIYITLGVKGNRDCWSEERGREGASKLLIGHFFESSIVHKLGCLRFWRH